MLQFETGSGHVFYLNHVISFVCIMGYAVWTMLKFGRGEKDKFLHITVSSILTFVGLTILELLQVSQWWWVPIGVIALGVLKEIIDRLNKKKQLFDWHDILSDLIGVMGIVSVYIFSFLMMGD